MKIEQHSAVGRRKTSVARCHLRPGSGNIKINGKTLIDFFAQRTAYEAVVRAPMKLTNTDGKFDLVFTVGGGGVNGQLEAIRHATARALEKADPALRGALKKAGFLTRDPREVERKKYGLHKARKRPQFSKR